MFYSFNVYLNGVAAESAATPLDLYNSVEVGALSGMHPLQSEF